MKKILLATAAFAAMASAASAERYVMITHTQGTDPFWPVVEKGAKDAATAVGATLEYNFDPSGDMSAMAKLIEAAAATDPDGIIVSLPDADALGGAIRDAVDAGIPVITINSGLESSKDVGALMHVGQPEYDAGKAAGERAKAEGVTNGLCLNQEAYNTALVDRCTGYFDAFGAELNQIDVSNDVTQIKTRTAAALQADETIDGLLAVGPHVCEAAWEAVEEVGADVHLSCFDLSPGVMDLIEAGNVAFTIDQQQRLQGYMPVIVLHLYNTNAGMLPGANVTSGPGFVDASNAGAVKSQAGVNR
ncbi:sugar ABC transporter substrate-binding protein [Mameliella sediminis]|uniref:sugar ABC transporter substrate-binding protein n=1 Tax=Mameliella sediminis TaxID=2836866 RepID=UPI001C46EED2|nr:sugar ABC transporter substrate-binding protein [Mameliella sediminis]MBY6115922.1 sugar ABC transporter substrate-binding protein [Antarctobacter heliothermus]MBY6145300.1 sugar ABC transporter substrate-binding protein [Mameliella alba]MBV7393976.1 sugar ABC transporter substrate-binding protein [Mameliella sediminis]MBY6162110.1 sugar ABC transporter substrate-binding protein [Mameliella alba]MBY6170580.1 sugar ABC transporter substrate-binding protein [Mameliella alba]